jgi:hypothetical protein
LPPDLYEILISAGYQRTQGCNVVPVTPQPVEKGEPHRSVARPCGQGWSGHCSDGI